MAIPEGRPREPMTSSQTERSPIEQPAIDELADVLSEATERTSDHRDGRHEMPALAG